MAYTDYMLFTLMNSVHPTQEKVRGKNKLLGSKTLICFIGYKPIKMCL